VSTEGLAPERSGAGLTPPLQWPPTAPDPPGRQRHESHAPSEGQPVTDLRRTPSPAPRPPWTPFAAFPQAFLGAQMFPSAREGPPARPRCTKGHASADRSRTVQPRRTRSRSAKRKATPNPEDGDIRRVDQQRAHARRRSPLPTTYDIVRAAGPCLRPGYLPDAHPTLKSEAPHMPVATVGKSQTSKRK
jgi:hypothetical protein